MNNKNKIILTSIVIVLTIIIVTIFIVILSSDEDDENLINNKAEAIEYAKEYANTDSDVKNFIEKYTTRGFELIYKANYYESADIWVVSIIAQKGDDDYELSINFKSNGIVTQVGIEEEQYMGPVITFITDYDNNTLTVEEIVYFDNDFYPEGLNWSDIVINEEHNGNATLPSGKIQVGDVITNCTGDLVLEDINGAWLGLWDFT